MRRLILSVLPLVLAFAITSPAAADSGYAIDGLRMRPHAFNFGHLEVNACNTEDDAHLGCTFKTITLTNNTSSAIVNIGIQFSDAPSPSDDIGFADQYNSCVTTLLPGQSCQIRLTANPTVLGKVRGSILFSSNGQFNLIAVIPVRATGY